MELRDLSRARAPGARLPSEAELMERFGVARVTVREAVATLVAEGLVVKVHGKGTFVTRPGSPLWLSTLAEEELYELINAAQRELTRRMRDPLADD